MTFAVRKIVQFLFAHAVDAAIAAHPEPAVIVFENLEDAVVIQPVFCGVACKASILESRQPAVICTDPQSPVVVLFERPHRGAGQSVFLRPGGEFPSLKCVNPPSLPSHRPSANVRDDDFGIVARETVFRGVIRRATHPDSAGLHSPIPIQYAPARSSHIVRMARNESAATPFQISRTKPMRP